METMRNAVVALFAAALFAQGIATAQEPSNEIDPALLNLRPDTAVVVVDRNGVRHDGFLRQLSTSGVVLAASGRTEEIPLTRVGRIERHGDSLWDGTLKGLVGGAPYWLVLAAFSCEGQGASCGAGVGLAAAAPFAALGAFIDSRFRGRTVAFGPRKQDVVDDPSDLWMALVSGDTITVTDAEGRTMAGIFQQAGGGGMTLLVNGRFRTVPMEGLQEVKRRGDSLYNGTVIGSLLGLLTGFVPCQSSRPSSCPGTGGRLVISGINAVAYGALGALFDSLHVGQTVIYRQGNERRSVRLIPHVAQGTRAVSVAFSF